MHDIFNDDNTEGILLIDAENAISSINRRLCYTAGDIIGGGELLSKQGTTQGNPASMGAYALGILPLLQFLLDFISVNELNSNDFTVAGKLSSIKDYWIQLTSIGPKYGYFPKESKSYLTVK